MKIYTSYYAKVKKLPDNVVPISISSKAPYRYKGLQYTKLGPKYDFFMQWKQTHDNSYYIEHFNAEVLALLTPAQVYGELAELSGGRDVALICYEKPTDLCHRHLVSQWLRDVGIPCEEIVC